MAGERVVGLFDPKAKCPKCGGEDVSSHWTPVGKHRWDHGCMLDGEHIHRACRRCWFGWVEAPLDVAPFPPPQAEPAPEAKGGACPACRGTGYWMADSKPPPMICPDCMGSGRATGDREGTR